MVRRKPDHPHNGMIRTKVIDGIKWTAVPFQRKGPETSCEKCAAQSKCLQYMRETKNMEESTCPYLALCSGEGSKDFYLI